MKNILVKEVFSLHGNASMLVPEEAGLDYVVALLGHERHLQGAFLVDKDRKLVGMVSRFDLLRWTRYQLFGEISEAKIQIGELSHLINARKAKDLETPNSFLLYVNENDTLQKALDLMIDYEEDIIPVLDSEGRIIGDLSLSEILSKALEANIQPQK
jgi:CBS domain-containing protein